MPYTTRSFAYESHNTSCNCHAINVKWIKEELYFINSADQYVLEKNKKHLEKQSHRFYVYLQFKNSCSQINGTLKLKTHTTTCRPPETLGRNNAAALQSYFRNAGFSQSERREGSGVIRRRCTHA